MLRRTPIDASRLFATVAGPGWRDPDGAEGATPDGLWGPVWIVPVRIAVYGDPDDAEVIEVGIPAAAEIAPGAPGQRVYLEALTRHETDDGPRYSAGGLRDMAAVA